MTPRGGKRSLREEVGYGRTRGSGDGTLSRSAEAFQFGGIGSA